MGNFSKGLTGVDELVVDYLEGVLTRDDGGQLTTMNSMMLDRLGKRLRELTAAQSGAKRSLMPDVSFLSRERASMSEMASQAGAAIGSAAGTVVGGVHDFTKRTKAAAMAFKGADQSSADEFIEDCLDQQAVDDIRHHVGGFYCDVCHRVLVQTQGGICIDCATEVID